MSPLDQSVSYCTSRLLTTLNLQLPIIQNVTLNKFFKGQYPQCLLLLH